MTIQELYALMGADYDAAIRIMRRDKLVDRSVRRFATSDLCDQLVAAGETMDETALFEVTHAMKGVAANLGITKLRDLASEVTDEFRPGNARTMSDEQVKDKLAEIEATFHQAVDAINAYIVEA